MKICKLLHLIRRSITRGFSEFNKVLRISRKAASASIVVVLASGSWFHRASANTTADKSATKCHFHESHLFSRKSFFIFPFPSRESGTRVWKIPFPDKMILGCRTRYAAILKNRNALRYRHFFGKRSRFVVKNANLKHFVNSSLILIPEARPTVNKPQEAISFLCIALSLRIFFDRFCRLLVSNENWIYFVFMVIFQALIPRFPYLWAATRTLICRQATQSLSVRSRLYLVHAANFSISLPFQMWFIRTEAFWGSLGWVALKPMASDW